MGTIKWKKPNGTEIETNDVEANVKYAESLGWKRVGQRGRPRKNVEDTVADPVAEPVAEPVVEPVAEPDAVPTEPGGSPEPGTLSGK